MLDVQRKGIIARIASRFARWFERYGNIHLEAFGDGSSEPTPPETPASGALKNKKSERARNE